MGIAAAVDIGTNSVKLVVGRDESDGTLTTLYDGTRITRLGQAVDGAGRLDPDAAERTLAALKELAALARSHGATRIAAIGTSALRDAADGAGFAARAATVLGGPVEIISGEREASLTFAAVARDPDLRVSGTVITSDIGGGSAEVVVGDGAGIRFSTSLQLGAVRLTERVMPSDPWLPAEIERARAEITPLLPPASSLPADGATFVACGGTAASLAGMALAGVGQPVNVDSIHGTALPAHALDARLLELAALPLRERRSVAGLEPDRAEVIVAGIVLQRELLRWAGADSLIVSARGLRYGLLYTLLESET